MESEAVRGHEPDGCKTTRDPEGPSPDGPELASESQSSGAPHLIEAAGAPERASEIISAAPRYPRLRLLLKSRVYQPAGAGGCGGSSSPTKTITCSSFRRSIPSAFVCGIDLVGCGNVCGLRRLASSSKNYDFILIYTKINSVPGPGVNLNLVDIIACRLH